MPRNPQATRARILAAADELYYAEGVRGVGLDEIAAKAGVTKKTLYYHFRSKDDLVAAYLEARDRPTLERYRAWGGADGSIAERMQRIFGKLAERAGDPAWQGCGFSRVVMELTGTPGHPALIEARHHKQGFERWLAEGLAAEGRVDAAQLARKLMLLLEGTITQLLIHRDPGYAEAAGEAVAVLLAAPAQGLPA